MFIIVSFNMSSQICGVFLSILYYYIVLLSDSECDSDQRIDSDNDIGPKPTCQEVSIIRLMARALFQILGEKGVGHEECVHSDTGAQVCARGHPGFPDFVLDM